MNMIKNMKDLQQVIRNLRTEQRELASQAPNYIRETDQEAVRQWIDERIELELTIEAYEAELWDCIDIKNNT